MIGNIVLYLRQLSIFVYYIDEFFFENLIGCLSTINKIAKESRLIF
jgi:hypothetical protein